MPDTTTRRTVVADVDAAGAPQPPPHRRGPPRVPIEPVIGSIKTPICDSDDWPGAGLGEELLPSAIPP